MEIEIVICDECDCECELIDGADPETGEPLTACCRSNQFHLEDQAEQWEHYDDDETNVDAPDDDYPDERG